MGGLTSPKGGDTKTTTQVQQVPAYAQAAQQNLLNAGNGVLGDYIAQPAYTTAGVNADQSGAFDLTRYLAQGAFTPSNNNLPANPGYVPTTAGNAATYGATGVGSVNGYAPNTGGAAAGYNAAQGGNANAYGAQSMDAAQLGANDFTKFMNPFIQGVIDPAVSNLRRQSDTNAAQIAAQSAASGSFGGSREALRQGQNTRALGEQTSQMVSQLMSAGYDRATALAQANAQMRQQANQSNQSAENAARQTNTGAQNQFKLTDVAAQNTANQANTNAVNQMAQFSANAANQAGQYNAGVVNQANQFNAGATNQASATNANATNSMALANAGIMNTAGQFNATQGMQAAQIRDALTSSDQTRKLQAIQALLGIGNAQQTMTQNNLNVPLQYLQALAQMTPQNYGNTTTSTAPNTANSPLMNLVGLGTSVLGMGTGGGATVLGGLLK